MRERYFFISAPTIFVNLCYSSLRKASKLINIDELLDARNNYQINTLLWIIINFSDEMI